MTRDKDNSAPETISLDKSGLRETRKVIIIRHLINSSVKHKKLLIQILSILKKH